MADSITIISKSEGGKLTRNRKLIAEAVANFEGKEVTVTIAKKRSRRSTNQNAYWYGVVVDLVRLDLRSKGVIISKEDIHIMLKLKVGEIDSELIYETIYDPSTGEVLSRRLRSTAEYSTSQFMDLISHVQQWAAEMLSLIIPNPNEQLTIN